MTTCTGLETKLVAISKVRRFEDLRCELRPQRGHLALLLLRGISQLTPVFGQKPIQLGVTKTVNLARVIG